MIFYQKLSVILNFYHIHRSILGRLMKAAQLNQQEEQERIKKQRAKLQKIKNEIRPAFAVKGKRKVALYNKL